MWQRTLGILLIVAACTVCYRNPLRFPDWKDAVVDAPLTVPQPVQVQFTAPESGHYLMAVACPYLPPTVTKSRKSVRPRFTTVVREGKRVVGNPGTLPTHYSRSAQMYLLKTFPAEAGHAYTVTVAMTARGQELQQQNARLRVLLDPNHYQRQMVHGMIALCVGAFWGSIGLLLTFWGGSRLPWRDWTCRRRPTAPSTVSL